MSSEETKLKVCLPNSWLENKYFKKKWKSSKSYFFKRKPRRDTYLLRVAYKAAPVPDIETNLLLSAEY